MATSQISASSQSFAFDDPDQYQSALRAAQAEIVVTGKGKFRSGLTKIDLPRLWMQRGHDNLPRLTWLTYGPTRVALSFHATSDQAPVERNGREIPTDQIMVGAPSASFHMRTKGPYRWASLSLTPEELAAASRAITGRELTPQTLPRIVRPAAHLVAGLQQLHRDAARMARSAPSLFAQPGITRAVEQTLIHAMVRCMGAGAEEESASRQRHSLHMARLEELLAANHDRPLYLAEICAAIGVAERTLRACCEEQLGMGPVRYLWLRRMHLARNALNRSIPGSATVTEVATAYGFWELGRFSVAYRRLFGESPSVSLSRSPDATRTPLSRPLALPLH